MANLLQSKQVWKLLDSPLSVAGFTTTVATFDDVTVQVQSILTAQSLVEAVATLSVAGVVESGNNRVEIRDATTKEKIDDGSGNEVYGRMTGGIGAWEVYYFSIVAGVETAFTMDARDIDFDFNYRFEFKDLPVDALTSTKQMVYDDVGNAKGYIVSEELTIAVQNTVPNTTYQTSDTTTFQLIVNGKVEDTLSVAPAVTASLANTTVTWSAANAGYNLDTTDYVVARYYTKTLV